MNIQKLLLLLIALIASVAYIVGGLLPAALFVNVLALLVTVLAGFIVYLFLNKQIELTLENVLGAMLAVMTLSISPIWIIAFGLAFDIAKVLVLPLALLFIVVLLMKYARIPVVEDRYVSAAVLLILGLSYLTIVPGLAIIMNIVALLEIVGILVSGALAIFGALSMLQKSF